VYVTVTVNEVGVTVYEVGVTVNEVGVTVYVTVNANGVADCV
jgi:hypothetical protein